MGKMGAVQISFIIIVIKFQYDKKLWFFFFFSSDEPIPFKLVFRQAENYPVDLYFLLDLSYSMVTEKGAQARLIALGQDMRKIWVLC